MHTEPDAVDEARVDPGLAAGLVPIGFEVKQAVMIHDRARNLKAKIYLLEASKANQAVTASQQSARSVRHHILMIHLLSGVQEEYSAPASSVPFNR